MLPSYIINLPLPRVLDYSIRQHELCNNDLLPTIKQWLCIYNCSLRLLLRNTYLSLLRALCPASFPPIPKSIPRPLTHNNRPVDKSISNANSRLKFLPHSAAHKSFFPPLGYFRDLFRPPTPELLRVLLVGDRYTAHVREQALSGGVLLYTVPVLRFEDPGGRGTAGEVLWGGVCGV